MLYGPDGQPLPTSTQLREAEQRLERQTRADALILVAAKHYLIDLFKEQP